MDTKGQHAIADIWLNGAYNESAILAAIRAMLQKYKVLEETGHNFTPHGLTKVWILGESHCSLHTYPEHNYISVDLYTCSDTHDSLDCLATLKSTLDCKHAVLRKMRRGIPCID